MVKYLMGVFVYLQCYYKIKMPKMQSSQMFKIQKAISEVPLFPVKHP